MYSQRSPKVSIIIPVYNAEKYIQKAVEGVLNQSLSDIEVIAIDDGSTDQSYDFLKNIQEKDERLKIIQQENRGPSAARNQGLKAATGEYIGFVDADDCVEETMFKKLVIAAQQTNADIVECGIYMHEGEKVEQYNVCLQQDTYEGASLTSIYDDFLFVTKPTTAGLWNKIYCRQTLIENGIQFNEEMHDDEDWVFNCDVLTNIKTFCKTPFLGYHYYRDNPNSITFKNHQSFIDGLLFKQDKRKQYAEQWQLMDEAMVAKINRTFINEAKWFVLYHYWHRGYQKEILKQKRQATTTLMQRKELITELEQCLSETALSFRQKLIIKGFIKQRTTLLRLFLLLEWKTRCIVAKVRN